MMKLRVAVFCGILLLTLPAYAFAAVEGLTGNPMADEVLSTLIFMAFVAYKVVDLITPGDLSKDIAENNNIALAVLTGSITLGVCIIIASVLAN